MSNPDFKSFLLTFWYRPAYSMRHLLEAYKGHVFALIVSAILGVTQFGRLIPIKTKSEELPLYLALCGACGIAGLFLFAWVVRNFGRWFGSEAELYRVRTALGFGVLPWTILFTVLSLLLSYGLDPKLVAKQYFPFLLGAFVYGFCVLILSLTAGLRLGIIKTFLCIVVTVLFGVIPLAFLVQLLVNFFK